MMRLLVLFTYLLCSHTFSPSLSQRQGAIVCGTPRQSAIGAVVSIRSSRPPLLLAGKAPPAEVAQPPGGTPLTALLVAVWYATSVICNQTSKVLVASLGSQTLTLSQMLVAVVCGAAVLIGLRAACSECVFPPVGISSREQLVDTSILAAAFTCGFITLNACLTSMHVSLVMVLRAAEPLTTLAIGYGFFGTRVPLPKAAVLLAVVAGCALSSVGSFTSTAGGLALATASNVCFSLRGLLGKRLAAKYASGDVEVFFQLTVLGAILQAALLACTSGTASFVRLATALSGASLTTVLLNGATFYAYLCLSWVCLGRMSAVSHSVANSLRRPVTVAAALVYAPVALSGANVAGIALACAAAAMYGLM
jgi:drug/metabolite transporter (DMT)-like permease